MLVVLLALSGAATRPAPAAGASVVPEPRAYILVDADSGAVLAAKDDHQPLAPASTVKLLTALVALEHLTAATPVPVSAVAASQPPMKIGLRPGAVWSLDQALHAMLIVSANDAAYAIAERTAGSLGAFALMTAQTAQGLGLRDSTFKDPAGLDDTDASGGGSRMSAYDLAIVARNVLAVPEAAGITKLVTDDFTDPDGIHHHLVNHNKTVLTSYPGATGLKTGFTNKAGRTIVTSATRDGRTMIAVVMDVYDTVGWSTRLMDQGFATPFRAPGTGERVPLPRLVTADARLRAFAAMPRALGPASAPSSTVTARPARGTPTPEGHAAPALRPAAARSAAPRGGELWSTGRVLIGVAVLGVAIFMLRRRALRRRRARRVAREHALAEKRRRRMIDVLEDPRGAGSQVRVVRAFTDRATRRQGARAGGASRWR